MNRQQLISQIRERKSYLCVGLDTDLEKLPAHLKSHPEPIFQFNKEIIDATKDLCVAYKINTAFYEAMGTKGWEAMERTVNYIPSTHFKIADAKRGDIGNTSSQYAKAFFEFLNFDAITVAPYMGSDSIKPFLDYENKWTIVLGLTSNPGAKDFEMQQIIPRTNELGIEPFTDETSSEPKVTLLYEKVIKDVSSWGGVDNLMFVIGATKASELASIRKIIPLNFLLIPGVGAQGGSLEEVSRNGLNEDCGLLVNASRVIIYAGNDEKFAADARAVAQKYQREMMQYLDKIRT